MIKRFVFVIFLLLVIFIANAFVNPFPNKVKVESQSVEYGFSYSFEQAEWYGLDPRDAYVELLDKYDFDWVRLSFFWDRHKEDGELDLDELEFAIEEANKRGVKVVVALGVKTPFYPEFHPPKNIKEQVKPGDEIGFDHAIADEILDIDKKVVSKLAKYENISHWQIENEPYLPDENRIRIDKSLLLAEISVVRDTDPKRRPVILTDDIGLLDNDYKQFIGLLSQGDVFGVNGYFKTQGTELFGLPWPKWFTWPVQSWLFLSPDYEGIKKYAEKRGVGVWLMEMQAEPYVRTLEDAKSASFAFNAGDIKKADDFVRSKGFEKVGFWGVNFWLFREKIGDSSWADAAKVEVRP